MKKKFTLRYALATLILSLCLSTYTVNAQHFNVGDKDVNLNIGLFNTYGGYISGSTMGIPPISLSVDYGLRDDWGPGVFSIGGYIAGSTSKWEDTYNSSWGYKYSCFIIGARATYHYELTPKLDTYAGAILGMRRASGKYTGDATGSLYNYDWHTTTGMFPVFVGAKYYFTDNFSVMTEVGWLIAWLNFGIGLKF